MTIDVYLSQILKASPPPTSLGLNIFPLLAPPGQQGNYSVYQLFASPPILTQDEDADPDTRVWRFQFRQFSPSPAQVFADTLSLRNFLVRFKDRGVPGIQRVIELNTIDLPTSAQGRTYCRMVELEITENLA